MAQLDHFKQAKPFLFSEAGHAFFLATVLKCPAFPQTAKDMTMRQCVFLFLLMCFSASGAQSTEIRLKKMQAFSGLSKKEILNRRIAAVNNSPVFGNGTPYRPADRVFQIEDGLPWISAYEITCFGVNGSQDIGKGLSRESVGILNPELLFYVSMLSFSFYSKTGCSEADYLIPYRAAYNEPANTLSAYINYTAFYRKNRFFSAIILQDANANDLGYGYAFADKTHNIRFKESVNLSTDVTPTQGFFHRGYSCKARQGCNNYSPYESRNHFFLTALPASIRIKLWKNRPAETTEEPDMTYELIFN